jgi:hypothetical protein
LDIIVDEFVEFIRNSGFNDVRNILLKIHLFVKCVSLFACSQLNRIYAQFIESVATSGLEGTRPIISKFAGRLKLQMKACITETQFSSVQFFSLPSVCFLFVRFALTHV